MALFGSVWEIKSDKTPSLRLILRIVPPFVTAHMFCAPRDGRRNSGLFRKVLSNTKVFLRDL